MRSTSHDEFGRLRDCPQQWSPATAPCAREALLPPFLSAVNHELDRTVGWLVRRTSRSRSNSNVTASRS